MYDITGMDNQTHRRCRKSAFIWHLVDELDWSDPLNVLYFAKEYYGHSGSRTHARSFFAALKAHPCVNKSVIFPRDENYNCSDLNGEGNINENRYSDAVSRRVLLRRRISAYIPETIMRMIKLYCPSPSTYRELATTIKKESIDAVVLRLGNNFRYLQQIKKDFPNLIICIEYNSTVFNESLRGIPGERFWRQEEIRQLGYADAIGVVSQYLKRYLVSFAPELASGIFVNPNGVDPELFKPQGDDVRRRMRKKLCIPDNAVVLGYVGGMETFRRLPEFIGQVASLRHEGLDRLFLFIIGSGHDIENVRKSIKKNSRDLDGWIRCTGDWIAHDRIPTLMSTFDITAFPYSNPYGSPQKLYEYMSFGLPIIAPDVPAVTESFDAQKFFYLVNQESSNLNAVVKHLYSNIDACKSEAVKNRKFVKQHFTWSDNAARVMDAIVGAKRRNMAG